MKKKQHFYFNKMCKTCQNFAHENGHNECKAYAVSTEELCEENGFLDYFKKEELK